MSAGEEEEAAPPLPPVHEALLDEATVDQLVGDLLGAATLHAVLVKGGAEALAEGVEGMTLQAAVGLLREGRVRAVQVRYTHAGRRWTDTLMRVGSAVRLVRMETP